MFKVQSCDEDEPSTTFRSHSMDVTTYVGNDASLFHTIKLKSFTSKL